MKIAFIAINRADAAETRAGQRVFFWRVFFCPFLIWIFMPSQPTTASDAAISPLAITAIVKLLSDEALTELLLRALDPAQTSEAEFSALADFAQPRAMRMMRSAHAVLRSDSASSGARKALAALDAPGEIGLVAQARFASTFGTPQWANWAAGMDLSVKLGEPLGNENPEAFKKKNSRGAAFASFLIRSTQGRFEANAWGGWAKACALNAIWADLTTRNHEMANARRQIAELRERGFIKGAEWFPAAERLFAIARRPQSGKNTSATAPFDGRNIVISLPSACDAGPDAVRLARLAQGRDFAASVIARSLGKNMQARLDALDVSGMLSEQIWADTMASPALAPEARSWMEARALKAEIAQAALPDRSNADLEAKPEARALRL